LRDACSSGKAGVDTIQYEPHCQGGEDQAEEAADDIGAGLTEKMKNARGEEQRQHAITQDDQQYHQGPVEGEEILLRCSEEYLLLHTCSTLFCIANIPGSGFDAGLVA